MRPTQHGLRLTPGLARAMSGAMAVGIGKEHNLSTEQRTKLSEGLARRMMETARKYDEPGQAFAEGALEAVWRTMAGGKGQLDPEIAREMGSRTLPGIAGVRELLDGFTAEIEEVIPKEAIPKLHEKMKEGHQALDRFERRMQRWSEGGMREGEHPFDDLDEESGDGAGAKTGDKPRPREVRQAEQIADWTVNSAGIPEWTSFLAQVKELFKFDEEQSAKGDRILEDYRERANQIMTPEWKEAMRRNRTKANLRHKLSGVPTIPWMWKLQHEYDQAFKPLQELGWSFRKDVLELLTPAQREAALAEFQPRAAEHGWTLDEKDKAMLGLSGSKWTLWKF
jgi:hypothetical protein